MNEEKLVPKLRFNGFNDEWNVIKLDNIVEFLDNKRVPLNEATRKNQKDIYPYYGASGIIDYVEDYIFDEELILIGEDGTIDVNLASGKYWVSNHAHVLKANEDISQYYLYEFLKTVHFEIYNTGTIQPKLNKETCKTIPIHLPNSLKEQNKIASCLMKINEKISLLNKKYDSYLAFKKYLMQQIFAQKLRFKTETNENYDDWKERKLSEFLKEHKMKSTGKEEVYSVSVHKGLVNQVEHLGRAFSAPDTSKYNLVKPGDIVYTKSPTGDFPLGIIKQSRVEKNVIVSPLYGVFTPETYALGYILNDYFESNVNTHNYLHPIVQKGAKNTMNITNKTFLSKSLFIPTDKDEQHKIAQFLMRINSAIELLENQKNQVEDFKKGLLQQMFV